METPTFNKKKQFFEIALQKNFDSKLYGELFFSYGLVYMYECVSIRLGRKKGWYLFLFIHLSWKKLSR